MPTDKYSFHPSGKKHPSKAGNDHGKLQLVKMQRKTHHWVPSPKSYIYNTKATPRVQGTLWKGGRRERLPKSQSAASLLPVCCIYNRKASPLKSHQFGHPNKILTMTTVDILMRRVESSQAPTTTGRTAWRH